MLLKKLQSLFFKKKEVSDKIQKDVIIASQTISLWTAGIKFDSRLEHLLSCRIKDKVLLVREPENVNDSNAIHVKTIDDKSLGFVGRNRAVFLAQKLDDGEVEAVGYVIELKSDLKNELYGVKISIPVTDTVFQEFKKDRIKEIDFVFDYSPSENLYILFSCETNVLDEVAELLRNNDVNVHRTGISYAASSAGKLYNWYIRIDNDSDQNKITKLLRQHYPILEEKLDKEDNLEYIELQDEELGQLKQQNQELINKVDTLEVTVDRYVKKDALFHAQFEKMIGVFLSDVEFIRDSMDVLKRELKDYTIALSKIYELYSDPMIRGKKVQSRDKWFEIHYSTGHSNDGRIYFKREGNKMQVLVSFKDSQKQDIQYLKD